MLKAQAAIEYLTTYGWAILIIIGVLAGLFTLGVLNPSTYSGRALPGACQIDRPYGPGSDQLLSLQGVCNSGLPKVLPYFAGGGQIMLPNAPILEVNSITIGIWIEPTSTSKWAAVDRGIAGADGTFAISNLSSVQPEFTIYSGSTPYSVNIGSAPLKTNVWYYLAASFNPSTGTVVTYLNGQQANTLSSARLGGTSTANILIGNYIGGGSAFSGYIANLQIYNASLSANEIHALYIEGIGSVPIQLQNLAGWWPLNSDINDYSGNGNSGVSATGVTFNPSWSTTYIAP